MYLTPFFSFSFILILCNPLFFKEIIPPLLIVQAFYNQEWEVHRLLTRIEYNISEYSQFMKKMESFLSKQPQDKDLGKWTVLIADTLYWFCEGGYHDKEFIDNLARIILERQESDGGWRVSTLKVGEVTPSGRIYTKELYDSGRTHATLMAILALECYRDHYLWEN